jgi:hypothetical protein
LRLPYFGVAAERFAAQALRALSLSTDQVDKDPYNQRRKQHDRVQDEQTAPKGFTQLPNSGRHLNALLERGDSLPANSPGQDSNLHEAGTPHVLPLNELGEGRSAFYWPR